MGSSWQFERFGKFTGLRSGAGHAKADSPQAPRSKPSRRARSSIGESDRTEILIADRLVAAMTVAA